MSRRIVVKIGSQVLCKPNGSLNGDVLTGLVDQLARLQANGWQVLLVSSGAVAAGQGATGSTIERISDPVARKQVLAATGQVRLMERYRACFDQHELTVAQVLATKADFQTRRHYLNMRGCIDALLTAGIVPVINENDVVATTELMFTDNDELAGLLAAMVGADLLCLLSTVPGVFDGDPERDGTRLIGTWDNSRHSADEIVSQATSSLGRGGMHSKLAIARKTAGLGTEVVIADGSQADILHTLTAGDTTVGTRFPAQRSASPAKRWLASTGVLEDAPDSASITVNEGARKALADRATMTSLLPVGVVSVKGRFDRGDVVQIRDESKRILGCGRTRCNDEEARTMTGKHGQKPLIHYDYLYLLD